MSQTVKRIACVGDSITFGHCASGENKSYPAVLGTLLGEGYEVLNFGRNSATQLSDYVHSDREIPYVACEKYQPSLVSNPDCVVIMLGMNDANPLHAIAVNNDGVVSQEHLDHYFTQACAMIDTYRRLPTKPQVFLCQTTWMLRQPCVKWTEHYIDRFLGNLEKILPVQRRVAEAMNAPYFDTRTDMRLPEYYYDGAHMTDPGYAALAATIERQLRPHL